MESTKSDLEKDILFRYYEDQWKHVRHHEVLRSNLTLQVIISAGALIVGYTQIESSMVLKFTISIVIIALGITGALAALTIKRTNDNHIRRARAARKELEFLELHANSHSSFASITSLYVGINGLVLFLGLVLFIITLVNCTLPA